MGTAVWIIENSWVVCMCVCGMGEAFFIASLSISAFLVLCGQSMRSASNPGIDVCLLVAWS